MRRVAILTQYYAPEIGAPQTRLGETARGLREAGWSVDVVTTPPHYPDGRILDRYGGWRRRKESVDGITVHRLPMWARPNRGFWNRIVDQASFATTALAARAVFARADVLIVESPPLFLGLTGRALRRLTGRPYLFHVADPWPDFPIAMGALRSRSLRKIAYAIEATAYAGATLITTVTEPLVHRLEMKPGAAGKVRLLANGVDLGRFDPSADAVAARAALDWPEARLTIVYAGTIGLAQGVATLVEAVAPLAEVGVVLHLVGAGVSTEPIRASLHERGIGNVFLHQAVAATQVPRVLAAADAVVITLRGGPLYEESLPTKLVEGLAAGRPLLVSASGEASRIVGRAGAGLHVPPEDPPALRHAIEHMLVDPDRTRMGRAGRATAEVLFDRRRITAQLITYLEEVLEASPHDEASPRSRMSGAGTP
jgi:glycosyltransferase involved in cell wall biosynthesis